MTATILNELWQKICGVFATQSQVAASLAGKQDKLTAGDGIRIDSDNEISVRASTELVTINVSSSVTGVSVEDLVINVYYEDHTVPDTTVTTDANGSAQLRVTNGYKYRLVFPDIQGCSTPADSVHYAVLFERSIEVVYEEAAQPAGMQLTIFAGQANATGEDSGSTPIAELSVNITIDGTTASQTTGSNGRIVVLVPYDKVVTIEVPVREGYELRGARTRSFTATQSAKYTEFIYYVAESGIKIVTTDGTEYTEEEFSEALENEVVTASDAKLAKISTSELAANNGVFYVSLDMLAERSGIINKTWGTYGTVLTDIPTNGNSASAAYYYDGRTASGLIQDEGDRRTLDTPAVDEALSRTFTLGESTLYGFLGSVGQWAILWSNRYQIDTILSITRPAATYDFSTYIASKWTSTQSSAGNAWLWASSATLNSKGFSYAVVPFFAF